MLARYLTSIALVAGVAAGWAVNWALLNVMPMLTEGAIHGNTSAPWVGAFYSCAFVVSIMVPGFIAGLVVGRHGILIGASAAAILALIAVLPEVLFMLRTPGWSLGDAARMLLTSFTRYPASIIASAVAGGCAQLLRSNNSPKRTREK